MPQGQIPRKAKNNIKRILTEYYKDKLTQEELLNLINSKIKSNYINN
jgi:hypothetical protein